MASNDWWSRKLSGEQPARRETPISPPSRREPWVPGPRPTFPAVEYDASQDRLMVTKAQSSRQTDNCPSCYSINYMAPQGTQMKRCYDCGYPIVQSGTGVGVPTEPGAQTMAAKQVHSGNNYNPNIVVDRIS